MEIKLPWGRSVEGVTIREFARIDLPLAATNHSGVYVDHVTIKIPSPANKTALVLIARGEDGYHVAREYYTRTGGNSCWPWKDSRPWADKFDAFNEGLRKLEATRGDGLSRECIEQARREYYSATHQQLTLF